MDLNIQDWGAIGELVGATAVVVTLIYFGIQLRQAADSVRASVAAMGSEYSTQVWQLPIDKPELAEMLQRGDEGTQNLSDNEYYRYVLFQGTIFRSFEQYFILHELGTLSDDQWAGWKQPLSQMLQYPGVKHAWEAAVRGQHARGFTQLVDDLITSTTESPTRRLFDKPSSES
jgi:hypothetical protein